MIPEDLSRTVATAPNEIIERHSLASQIVVALLKMEQQGGNRELQVPILHVGRQCSTGLLTVAESEGDQDTQVF